jgi:hypothetical protein
MSYPLTMKGFDSFKGSDFNGFIKNILVTEDKINQI